MQEIKSVILTGKYIQLEPLEEVHRETLRMLSQDDNISRYSPALKFKFDAWFNKALKKYTESRQVSFVVRDVSNKKIIGSTRYYEISMEHKRLSIGYTWYIPEVWGTVVNKECKLLLLQYVFDTLHFNRVEFFIDSRNERSRAAVKKLGATEEGLMRQHVILEDGYVRDTVVCSIIKTEWPSICMSLNKKITK